MENKYYTPSIEEFHVGFEYERYEKPYYDYKKEFVGKKDQLGYIIKDYLPTDYICMKSGWTKETFDIEDKLPNVQWINKDGILEPLCTETRVKYLDKEDIESLGFKQSTSDNYWYDYKNNKYWLYKEWEKDWRWIISDEESEISFAGSIKNKSELKRLLKQLNIINE